MKKPSNVFVGQPKVDGAVIHAENLSLTFQTNDGPVHAFKDVNLDVEKG